MHCAVCAVLGALCCVRCTGCAVLGVPRLRLLRYNTKCGCAFVDCEVQTIMMMTIRVFGDVTPSKKIGLLDPENGSSTIVRKVGNRLPITTV